MYLYFRDIGNMINTKHTVEDQMIRLDFSNPKSKLDVLGCMTIFYSFCSKTARPTFSKYQPCFVLPKTANDKDTQQFSY